MLAELTFTLQFAATTRLAGGAAEEPSRSKERCACSEGEEHRWPAMRPRPGCAGAAWGSRCRLQGPKKRKTETHLYSRSAARSGIFSLLSDDALSGARGEAGVCVVASRMGEGAEKSTERSGPL